MIIGKFVNDKDWAKLGKKGSAYASSLLLAFSYFTYMNADDTKFYGSIIVAFFGLILSGMEITDPKIRTNPSINDNDNIFYGFCYLLLMFMMLTLSAQIFDNVKELGSNP